MLIIGDCLKARIIPNDQNKVGQGIFHSTTLIDLKSCLPIDVTVAFLRKVRKGCRLTLFGKLQPDLRILGSELLHRLIRRELCRCGVRLCLFIQRRKLVHADQVKGI